ncbi:MAG TPA: polyphosphate kinase 1 [Anaerolineae bacterium]|nr:polyphosphate kinase 1 [Anaerolineae bacterium]
MIETPTTIPSDEVEEASNAFIQQVTLDQDLDEAILPVSLALEEVEPAGAGPQDESELADLSPLDETELASAGPQDESELAGDSFEEVGADVAWNAAPAFTVPLAVAPRPVPEQYGLDDPSLYFNQELSWLDFNWRVLWLALDERTPLLERVRFAAITASNLDEFYQKRVGGLKRQRAAGVRKLTPDGRTPEEQLELIREAAGVMHKTMTAAWEQQLKPALADKANVVISDYDDLNIEQRYMLREYFQTHFYPILTPLTVDPGHPFPFISNLSLSLAVLLRHPQWKTTHFARIKAPMNHGRWLRLPATPGDDRLYFLPVEQLIIHNVGELFRGMDLLSVHPFRITRNADVRRDEEEAEDLLASISAELRVRRFAGVVRMEVAKEMPEYVRNLLMREMELTPAQVVEVDGLLDLTGCFQIADLNLPKLRYRPWEPVIPTRLAQEGQTKDTQTIFAIIRQGDLLVHHPYESFAASTQRFIEEAAADPGVVAIKQTLYRTSDESPIVAALMRAAEQGKQVAVLVEVKARFDEANNIEWAQRLENVGVHVTYGVMGLKTHSKATLVVRQEPGGLRIYCHIGTGNYHPKTARLYTDLGLFTCSPDLSYDIVNLFHSLTGYSPDQRYRRAIVAPRAMRSTFVRLIQQEIDYQQRHGNGRIIAKMNALDDVPIIQELYRASQAGVQIDLIIRGHSRLRPGLPGISDNIRVVSILGRFLEHDRIFYFHNNGTPYTLIGSADWRGRNLDERVELIVPVEEPALQQQLIRSLYDALADNRLAWDLHSDGRYVLRWPGRDEEVCNFHETLMRQATERAKIF